jgi:adenylosuccinate lyase
MEAVEEILNVRRLCKTNRPVVEIRCFELVAEAGVGVKGDSATVAACPSPRLAAAHESAVATEHRVIPLILAVEHQEKTAGSIHTGATSG